MNHLITSLFSLLMLTYSCTIVAQEIVGSAGATDTTINSQVTWSVGEVIIETGTVGSTDLTQGYVQPIFSIVSIEETNSSNFTISLFPNPANQEFNIVVDRTSETRLNVRITNISGQLVKEESFEGIKHTVIIDELLPATYFVEIHNEQGTYYNKLKLVKTH